MLTLINGSDTLYKLTWTGRMLLTLNPMLVQNGWTWRHPPTFSNRSASNTSVAREARFIKKLVTGTKHTRKKWFGGESSSSTMKDMSFLMEGVPGVYREKTQKPKTGGRTLRRVGVLSTVFMEHITELLATGEESLDIAGLGLEITQVKISSDFTTINVYWYCSKAEKEEILEGRLKASAGKLRHVLSQLRVIGQVPPIMFVKDNKYTRLMEVENILTTLDFGEDYEPSPLGHTQKVAMSSRTFRPKKSQNISEQLEESIHSIEGGLPPSLNDDDSESESDDDSESESDDDSESESDEELRQGARVMSVACPSSMAVRQDMLGLNWDTIMNGIKLEVAKTAKRRRDAHIEPGTSTFGECETPVSHNGGSKLLEEVTQSVTRQKEFLEFLKQRRIQRSKTEKRLSNETRDREFLAQEKDFRTKELLEQFDFIEQNPDDEDYLIEDDKDFSYRLDNQFDLQIETRYK